MKGASLLIFAAIAMSVVYAGLAVAIPPGAFFSGDEGVHWLQTDSIIRHRWTSLAVDPPGGDLDPEARFLPPFLVEKQGRIRSIHPAFMPLLASLPYAVAGMRGMYLIPAISAILCLVAATSLARSVLPQGTPGGWAALAGAAAVAGSPLIFYGATLWEHAPAAALCTLAMIPLCRGGRDDENAAPEPGRAAAAGFLIGLAAVARAEAALLLPAAALGGALAWGIRAFLRPAAALAAGGAFVLAPQALYHRAVFGGWLPPHLAGTLVDGPVGRAPGGRSRAASVAMDLIPPVGWSPAFVLVAVLVLAFAAGPSRARLSGMVRPGLLSGAAVVLASLLLAAGPLVTIALEFSDTALSTRERGYTSLAHTLPAIALLPFLLIPAVPRAGPRPRLVGWTAGLFVLLAVLFAPVPGGLQWGPRLLLPAVPLLTVALLAAMARRRGGARGRLAVAMLAVALTAGVAVQLIGLRFLVTVRSYNASMMARVEEATPEGGVILSDDFAVPQLLAPLSVSHPMLYVPRGADLEALGARMRAAGASPLWIVKRRSRLSPEAAGEEINLGAGLLLVRRDAEDGARGYLTMPKGD